MVHLIIVYIINHAYIYTFINKVYLINSHERVILVLCTIGSKINGTPQKCLLVHFEAVLDFSRTEFTCP